MKKFLSMLLVLSMMFSLVAFSGCTKEEEKETTGSSTSTESNTTETATSESDSKDDGTLDIGIVLPTKEEPRWVQDEARFIAALGDTDYKVEILFSQGDSAKEKQNVETLIAKGIDVLIITPQDGAAAAAAVEAAKEEGITVISYDRLVTNTDAVDYYITFNSVSVGAAQGQYLVDQLNGATGQNLYLYAGAATDNNAFLFFEGAWNVLQPKIADGTFVVQNSSKAVEYKIKPFLPVMKWLKSSSKSPPIGNRKLLNPKLNLISQQLLQVVILSY